MGRMPLASIGIAVASCGRVGFDPPRDSITSDACPAGELIVDGACKLAIAIDSSLVAYWPLDEATGATMFRDLSPNANDGTCSPCPTSGVVGVRGSAVTFAAANDSIVVGSGPSLSNLTAGLTVLGWVKMSSHDQYGYILSNDRDCSGCGSYAGFGLLGSRYMGGAMLELRDGTSIAHIAGTPMPLSLGVWHFVAGTFDGTTIRIYLDGQLASSGSGTLAAPPTYATRLGALAADPSQGIHASVDEVMVFGRALDATEISNLHAYFTGT